jgi:predicted dehydrogenase
MKIGIVGCGYWGPNLVRNVMANERCTALAVCDSKLPRLESIKRRFPSVELWSDARAMFADESLDGVMIATPVSSHHALGRAALLAGKHVFIEKPFAASISEAEELVELARSRGRTLMVGHTFLYSPPVRKIKEIIDRGDLGEIYYIASSRVNLGIHQKDVSVLWDLAPHDLAMIFHWLSETPSDVSASGQAFVQPGIPDVAFVNLRFPSGAMANVHVSWLSPSKLRQMTIVGSRKMLVYDDTASAERVKIFDKGVDHHDPRSFGEFQLSYRTGDIVSPRLDTAEPLAVEAEEFLRCMASGDTPLTDGWNGLEVVRALELADRSLVSGMEHELATGARPRREVSLAA